MGGKSENDRVASPECLKSNGCIFRRKSSALFSFFSLLKRRQLLIEIRNLPLKEYGFSLIVDPTLKSLCLLRRQIVVVVVVALLFYVHSKHLRSCRDGQLT